LAEHPSAASATFTFSRAFALIQVLALNGVPLYGVYVLGWSWGTVLVLYWCETVLGTLFIAFRMIAHWLLTHDPGYSHPLGGTAPGKSRFGAFLFDFTAAYLFASFVHGIFLALILNLILKGRPEAAVDFAMLRKGLLAMALIMTGSLALDCLGLRKRPFEWIRDLAERPIARIVVVQLAILFGMIGINRFAKAPFVVFALVKLLVELGSLARGQKTLEPAPEPIPAAVLGGVDPVAIQDSGRRAGKRRGVHGRSRGR
jgi:hypothetical protein